MVREKGQIVVYDLLFGLIIFAILLAVFMLYWNTNLVSVEKERQYEEMKSALEQTANTLIETQGQPGNWDKNYVLGNVNSVGLIRMRKREIYPSKLTAFINADYNKMLKAMKLQNYNFYFKLEQDNKMIGEKMYGSNPYYLTEHALVVSTQRVVEYNGKIAVLTLKLYK